MAGCGDIEREIDIEGTAVYCKMAAPDFGKCMLGKTVVVNAGFGPDKNVLLEIEGSKIKQLKFYRKP